MPKNPRYRRVLLKLSGEALKGQLPFGFDPAASRRLAQRIKEAHALGVELACVIGGGNIFRGAAARGIERTTADYMGMLATVMNALALQAALENVGVATRVQTAIEMRQIAEPFIRRRAVRHLEKGRVVIFAAGTGNPYFSTDTAAALRANEIAAEAIIKATKVDGIYTADPKKDPTAKRYARLTFAEALARRLAVMDSTAFSLCFDNNIPIIVFDFSAPGGLRRVLLGDLSAATIVTQ